MKRKLVIVLLSLYVLASTECHQVLRLPLLVKHYSEHHQKADNLTFWEFLVLHYKTDVAHDDQDMRLPFKDCHHSLASSSMAVPSQRFMLTPLSPALVEKILSFNHPQVHSSFPGEVFQPPRI